MACQVPLSTEFPRQEHWSGLPFPPPGDLSETRDWTLLSYISCIGRQVLYHEHHLGSLYTGQDGHCQNIYKHKYWRGCGGKGTLLYCWWKCKLVHPLWRTVWRFLKKLIEELTYDPAISFLGICTKNTIIWKDTCIPTLISALFTIVRTWKQPKCPSIDE